MPGNRNIPDDNTESAYLPTRGKYHTIEQLLAGDPEMKSVSWLSRVWIQTGCTLAFGFGGFLNNYINAKPLASGIPRYILYGLIGLGVGQALRSGYDYMSTKEDAVYHHYYLTHKDQFPEPKNIKLRYFWHPWYPVR